MMLVSSLLAYKVSDLRVVIEKLKMGVLVVGDHLLMITGLLKNMKSVLVEVVDDHS